MGSVYFKSVVWNEWVASQLVTSDENPMEATPGILGAKYDFYPNLKSTGMHRR